MVFGEVSCRGSDRVTLQIKVPGAAIVLL